MNQISWKKFVKARKRFREAVEDISRSLPQLKDIQQRFADSRGENSFYKVETPVVYNSALDEITSGSTVKLILVADNPGRREQAAENRRYLVGPSGKIAQKFFHDNGALGIDYLKNVIILNKTPIHSPRTADLRRLVRLEAQTGGSSIAAASQLKAALEESQKTMAALLLEFHEALACSDKNIAVYITGYSEMKKGGIFEAYTEKLKEIYKTKPELSKQLFIFRHFSMNQFTIDLKQKGLPGETTAKTLSRIGTAYRKRILT